MSDDTVWYKRELYRLFVALIAATFCMLLLRLAGLFKDESSLPWFVLVVVLVYLGDFLTFYCRMLWRMIR